MAGSFRRRLLAIAALTVLACGAAITAILFLSRTTSDERREHARENVTREVERLGGALATVPPAERSRRELRSGELRSRYVAAPAEADEGAYVTRALERAASGGRTVVLDETDDEGTAVLVAASPVPGGGYVFALHRVVAGRETRGLRLVVLAVALLSFLLVVASLRTLSTVERDVSVLRASLAALAKDLGAPVARPTLRELDEVAGGVAALAKELDAAQKERERLTGELARARAARRARPRRGGHRARGAQSARVDQAARRPRARRRGAPRRRSRGDLDDIASEIARLDRLVERSARRGRAPLGPAERSVELGALVRAARRRCSRRGRREQRRDARVSGDAAVAHVDAGRDRARASTTCCATRSRRRRAARASRCTSCARDGEARVVVVDHGGRRAADARAGELFEPFFTTKPDGDRPRPGAGPRRWRRAHDGTLTLRARRRRHALHADAERGRLAPLHLACHCRRRARKVG